MSEKLTWKVRMPTLGKVPLEVEAEDATAAVAGDVFTSPSADAVLAASIFHFGEYTVPEAKAYLASRGIVVR